MNRARLLSLAALIPLAGLVGCEHAGVFEPFREVECLERAPVSLRDAIAAAEAGGATALDADYRQDEELGCEMGAAGAYDVTLVQNRTISLVSVDARTAAPGPRQPEGVMNALFGSGARFEGSPAYMAQMSARMTIPLSEAVRRAEMDGGKALAAWIEAKDGRPGYTVKVVKEGRVDVTWIDGVAGA
jgi:hypothetical protein